MAAERHEFTALFLIAGMAGGVLFGETAFPQVSTALGDTLAGWVLATGGAAVAGLGYEIAARFHR